MDTWTLQELAEVLGLVDKNGKQLTKDTKEVPADGIVLWETERIYAMAKAGDRAGYHVFLNKSKPSPLRRYANPGERIYVEGVKKKTAPRKKTVKEEGGEE